MRRKERRGERSNKEEGVTRREKRWGKELREGRSIEEVGATRRKERQGGRATIGRRIAIFNSGIGYHV